MMLVIGTVLCLGTLYESSMNAEAAQQLIYKTPWFITLLALLFINILFSTLKRWPFKKHHTGFVVTHIGLLILLAGSMVSKVWGIEGILALREGESSQNFETKIEALSLNPNHSERTVEKRFTSNVNTHPWEKEFAQERLHLTVDQFLPNSSLYQYYVQSPSENNSALRFKLSNGMTEIEDWLELKNREKNLFNLGLATLHFKKLENEKSVQKLLALSSKKTPPSKAVLKILIPEKALNHDFEVHSSLGKTIPIQGTGLSLSLLKFYTHAIVADGKLINKSENWINPAVEFEILGPQGKERHLAFSLYPDFNTVHGQKKLYALDTRLVCNVNSPQEENSLTVFAGPQNKLYYKLLSRTHPAKTGELDIQKALDTGWMGLQFEVQEFIPMAAQATKIRDAQKNLKSEDNTPAIHTILKDLDTGQTADVWLQRQTLDKIKLGDRTIEIGYHYQDIPMGFSIRLLDFILEHYPGSNQPKSYESRVQVKDPNHGPIQDQRIYMNHPLKHRGYKFFQSSYVPGNGASPDISVFSVNHDPGVPMIYGGSLIMVIGIYMLFFVKSLRKNIVRTGALLIFALGTTCFPFSELTFDFSVVDQIAVQDNGRIKPFQTFANETLRLLTGKTRFQDKSATENLLDLMFRSETAIEKPIIRIAHRPLLENLGLDPTQKYFSLKSLSQNEKLSALFQTLAQKEQHGLTLSPLEKKAAQIYQQMEHIHRLYTGEALKILPDPQSKEGNWLDINHLEHYDARLASPLQRAFKEMIASFQKGDAASFNQTSQELKDALRQLAPETYPSEHEIQREIFYNGLRPFQKAWLFYLLAFVFLALFGKKKLLILGIIPFTAGFILHATGLALRVLISGRAPVSNMYESMVFLVWGLCLFALLLGIVYRGKIFLTVASFLGFVFLLMAESVPIDSSISQLVPVLRSNFWLTLHVLTIMLSYSAFALAMGIGHYSLGLFIFRPQALTKIQSSTRFLYRLVQIGVILLIAGTLLGGIWANESWGRFWGWDPKETWALISILGYLAVVHARSAGWIDNFGLAVSSIAAFVLILMTYYGVNFILAAGLHSYGFGSGGTPYIMGYLSLEILIIASSLFQRYRRADEI